MKRIVAIILTLIMLWSSGLLGLAEAYAATLPVVIEKTDDYTIWQNANGSRTIRIESTTEEPTDPTSQEPWTDQGDGWSNEGSVARTRLYKSYSKNKTLVALSRSGTSISFAPIMNEEPSVLPEQEAEEAAQKEADAVGRCPSCGHGNPEGVKFCQECGAKLGASFCVSCGAEMKPGVRFCGECGSSQGN